MNDPMRGLSVSHCGLLRRLLRCPKNSAAILKRDDMRTVKELIRRKLAKRLGDHVFVATDLARGKRKLSPTSRIKLFQSEQPA